MILRPEQAAAVTRTGQDVCVVAGPGSGKTRVLVERFAWLIRERHISPLRILAITFTEKAATEIQQRLAREFAANAEIREQVERAWVSTVHGFCARLLREHPIAAGLDPEFTVLEAAHSAAVLQEAVHEALDRLYRERPGELRRLLEAVSVSTWSGGRQPDMAEALAEIHEAMRVAGRTIAELRERSENPAGGLTLAAFAGELRGLLATAPSTLTLKQRAAVNALNAWAGRAAQVPDTPVLLDHFRLLKVYPKDLPRSVLSPDLKELRDERGVLVAATLVGAFYAPLRSFLLDALELAGEIYRERKRGLAALDFSDLEERAVELLRSDAGVLAAVRGSFDQILMDELQDTNPLQWTLIDLVRSPQRFFAVGDINQSIFGFRHADPEVFRRYRLSVSETGGEIDELDENYRSRADILHAVSAVTGHVDGIEARQLQPLRAFVPKDRPSVEVIAGFGADKIDAERVEARWIARRILELVGTLSVEDGDDRQRPARFRDVAVLVRTANALPPILDAFQEFGVPYLTEGGRTFYETREVRDLVHLLQVISNPANELALAGVLRSPLVGIGDETLLRGKRQAGSLEQALSRADGLDAAAFEAEDAARFARFASLLAGLRAEQDDVSPDRLLARALDACDYEGGLEARARVNAAKFLSQIRRWHRARPRPVAALLEDLQWLRNEAAEAEAPPDDASDVVRVMSIHKAKGLQFPVVVLPALHRGAGNSGPSICLTAERSLAVSWRNPVSGDSVKDLAYASHQVLLEEREKGEENRLLYVAMTRAEEHLVLSFAMTPKPSGKNWRLVVDGLGLDVEAANNVPVILEAGAEPFPVRVLLTAELAEPIPVPAIAMENQAEPLLVARPPVSDQHDATASVTSIQLFAECPRRYFLSRYIGWDVPLRKPDAEEEEPLREWDERDGPSAAEFGVLVHELLAGVAVDGAPPEALDLAERFRASELGQRASRASRAEREFDFVMAVEDIVLRGQIDLWFEEGGELILVDYKTDRVGMEEGISRAESYALQLRLYALALERIAGRTPDRAFICLLRTGQTVPIALAKPLLAEAQAGVRGFREAQSSLRFELREGDHCHKCPHFGGRCPAGLARGEIQE
jgi:ATP-dependent exoDNAse (exonuclease V) beta subunit